MSDITEARRDRGGFTLIELLVVIGIIAILLSILVPTLSKARAQAQDLQCASNLRTIGQALHLYAMGNRGSLPFGDFLDPVGSWDVNAGTANWSIRIASTLNRGKAGENFYNSTTNKGVFRCPTANISMAEAPDRWTLHYTCHPRLMPGFSLNPDPAIGKRQLPYKLGKIKNSSEIVMIFDGSQYWGASGLWEGNAHPLGSGVDNWRCNIAGGWGHALLNPSPVSWDDNMDASIDAENRDCFGWNGTTQQCIRWRHGRNNKANFLYADGHVGGLLFKGVNKTELQRRNVCVNRPS
jgi:prepilin-type N-terminal cleavage/methylation domain-containing protein/prepilin-type processing-associated H-X9-DG protein